MIQSGGINILWDIADIVEQIKKLKDLVILILITFECMREIWKAFQNNTSASCVRILYLIPTYALFFFHKIWQSLGYSGTSIYLTLSKSKM